MITTNAATGRFTLRIDAPALAVSIFVVEPEAVATTFLFFLCHKLFESDYEHILFQPRIKAHALLRFIYSYLVDLLLDIRLVIFRIAEEKMNVCERL